MVSSNLTLVHITTVPQSLRFFTGQIGFMQMQGITIHVLSSPGELLEKFALQEKVVAHAIKMPRKVTPLQDVISVFQIFRLLHGLRPQIVHAHTPKGGLLGMIGAWLAKVPVRIYHIHGLPLMTARGYKRWLLRWSEQVACRLAHQVLCVSSSIREVVVSEHLCSDKKVKVLHHGSINGVDASRKFDPQQHGLIARQEVRERFDIPSTALVIGFVGRMVRDKGLIELVRAWKVLKPAHPDLHLLVIGEFESQDPVPPEIVSDLNSDPRIHLTGRIVTGMPQHYQAMDIVVLPSYREGFPVTPLEAAAMELPVVATRIPGCIEAVVDGETGTLVTPYDVPDLARALNAYLIDPEKRYAHGQAARKRILSEFCPEDIWQATYEEYKRLLVERNVIAS